MSKQPKKSAAPVMKESNKAMEVDTVIIRNMVEVMAMDIPLMEAMVMEEDINRMAKDTEVDMEVTETTNLEAMVVTAVSNLEAMAATVATNSEVMEATEVVMATLIPIIPQTKMNTSQKLLFLKSFFNHVFYSVISNIHIRRLKK